MRVMSWNIFKGAQDPARYELVKKVVHDRQPDVLCLQEADYWNKGKVTRLAEFATEMGFEGGYAYGSKTDCLIATFSRPQIRKSKIRKHGFFHGAIKTWIEGDYGLIPVVNTHFNPFAEHLRQPEVRYITAEFGRDAVITGDMNSLSRSDGYPSNLYQMLEELNHLRYGIDEVSFDVTDTFARNGFVDVAAIQGANQPTFPALKRQERYQFPTRFDYVFAPRDIAAAVQSVNVVMTPETDLASDHRPIEFEIVESALARILHAGSLGLAA